MLELGPRRLLEAWPPASPACRRMPPSSCGQPPSSVIEPIFPSSPSWPASAGGRSHRGGRARSPRSPAQENPLEFIHPVVRTAVLEDMSAVERIAGHRRAAEVLLETGALPEQAAAHLAQTLPAHDPFVITTLRLAAERSLAQGAPEAAVGYLRRALEEPPPSEQRVDVLYELGVAELNSNAAEASEHLGEAVAALTDAAERPDILLAYSHSLIATDRPEDAIDVLQRTSDRDARHRPRLALAARSAIDRGNPVRARVPPAAHGAVGSGARGRTRRRYGRWACPLSVGARGSASRRLEGARHRLREAWAGTRSAGEAG